MQKFFSKSEVAEIFGVNPRTIERWLRAGKLEGAIVGKAWRVSEEDINKLYETFKEETKEELKKGGVRVGTKREEPEPNGNENK